MIALLVAGAADPGELERLSKAVAACDRPAISRAWKDEVKRHGDFIVDSVREQASIVADRRVLAERRRKSRGTGPAESETALTAAAAELDERQRAADDQRRLDGMHQEAVIYFRQQFITQCNGRDL